MPVSLEDEIETAANARLIAAAPELLRSLKAAVAIIQGWEQAAPIHIAYVADYARAIIAKAEGN